MADRSYVHFLDHTALPYVCQENNVLNELQGGADLSRDSITTGPFQVAGTTPLSANLIVLIVAGAELAGDRPGRLPHGLYGGALFFL